ncbi:hypothetical protein ACEOWG_002148 [Bacillus cereus]
MAATLFTARGADIRLKRPSFKEQKLEKLKKRSSKKASRISIILSVEASWERYSLSLWETSDKTDSDRNFTDLMGKLKVLIEKKAKFYGKSYCQKRIYEGDFLAEFYIKAWQVIESYTHYEDFYLYEQLNLALDCAAIDLIRKHLKRRSKKNTTEEQTVSEEIKEYRTQIQFETDVRPFFRNEVNLLSSRDHVQAEILIKECLGELEGVEREVFDIMLTDQSASLRDIGEEVGLPHPMQVKRVIKKMQTKLRESMYAD